jgi:hypothetical protein
LLPFCTVCALTCWGRLWLFSIGSKQWFCDHKRRLYVSEIKIIYPMNRDYCLYSSGGEI